MDFHPIDFIIFLLFIFLMYLIYKIIRGEKVEDNKKELVLLDADDAHDLAIEYNRKYFLIAHEKSMKHIVEGIKEASSAGKFEYKVTIFNNEYSKDLIKYLEKKGYVVESAQIELDGKRIILTIKW